MKIDKLIYCLSCYSAIPAHSALRQVFQVHSAVLQIFLPNKMHFGFDSMVGVDLTSQK